MSQSVIGDVYTSVSVNISTGIAVICATCGYLAIAIYANIPIAGNDISPAISAATMLTVLTVNALILYVFLVSTLNITATIISMSINI